MMMDSLRTARELYTQAAGSQAASNQALAARISTEHENKRLTEIAEIRKAQADSDDDDLSSDSDLESDDEAFQAYRDQRINLVRSALPTFGTYFRVETVEMLRAHIQTTHELCYVICHVYANHVPACARLHLVLEDVARQFPQVKFLRVRSEDTMSNFHDLGLPCLMIYRGGTCLETFMSVGKEIGAITDPNVVAFLARHGVLKSASTEIEQKINELDNDELMSR